VKGAHGAITGSEVGIELSSAGQGIIEEHFGEAICELLRDGCSLKVRSVSMILTMGSILSSPTLQNALTTSTLFSFPFANLSTSSVAS
jgi:hypothetical protein